MSRMECGENADLLLEFAAGRLDAEAQARLDRHLEVCPACRELAGGQRAVWAALDAWEAAAGLAGFRPPSVPPHRARGLVVGPDTGAVPPGAGPPRIADCGGRGPRFVGWDHCGGPLDDGEASPGESVDSSGIAASGSGGKRASGYADAAGNQRFGPAGFRGVADVTEAGRCARLELSGSWRCGWRGQCLRRPARASPPGLRRGTTRQTPRARQKAPAPASASLIRKAWRRG